MGSPAGEYTCTGGLARVKIQTLSSLSTVTPGIWPHSTFAGFFGHAGSMRKPERPFLASWVWIVGAGAAQPRTSKSVATRSMVPPSCGFGRDYTTGVDRKSVV